MNLSEQISRLEAKIRNIKEQADSDIREVVREAGAAGLPIHFGCHALKQQALWRHHRVPALFGDIQESINFGSVRDQADSLRAEALCVDVNDLSP